MSIDKLRKLFNEAVAEFKVKNPQYKSLKITWHSLRSGMIGILFSIGLSEPEIKQISLHSKHSSVLREEYLSKLKVFQNTYLRTFFKEIFKFGKLQHTLPRKEIRRHAQELFSQVDPLQKAKIKDTKDRLNLENSLHKKLSGINVLSHKKSPISTPPISPVSSPQNNPNPQFQLTTPANKPEKNSKRNTYTRRKPIVKNTDDSIDKLDSIIQNDIIFNSDSDTSSDDNILQIKKRTQPYRKCKKIPVPSNPNVNLNIVEDTYFSDMDDSLLTTEEFEDLLVKCDIEYYDTGIPFLKTELERNLAFKKFCLKWSQQCGSLVKDKLTALQELLDEEGAYLNV